MPGRAENSGSYRLWPPTPIPRSDVKGEHSVSCGKSGSVVAVPGFGVRGIWDGHSRLTAQAGWRERHAYDAGGNLTHVDAPAPPMPGTGDIVAADRESTGTLVRRAGPARFEHDAQGRVVSSRQRRPCRGADRLRLLRTSSPAGVSSPLRFSGQYHDEETGLNYNVHRYYDPENVRYQSPDPLGGLAPPCSSFRAAAFMCRTRLRRPVRARCCSWGTTSPTISGSGRRSVSGQAGDGLEPPP